MNRSPSRADIDATTMAAGKITAEEVAARLLERVRAREGFVRAWSSLDPAGFMEAARARDREIVRGPLHGIPVAIKDVLDTADMPTEYGSPIYRHHRPAADASCVSLIRAAGGLIMGKTATTEFATRHPCKTRNPHNLAHTPGGSSSGSAAAVADGMVPLALGTQTSGSVIRPAAYCGVIGFKPSYGMINRSGLKYLAESLDTIGIYSRTIGDAGLLWSVLSGNSAPDVAHATTLRPRIGVCRTPQWPHAEAETISMLIEAEERLSRAGAEISSVVLRHEFEAALDAQESINDFESWRAFAYERLHYPELLSPLLTAKLENAAKCTRERYEQAQETASICRRSLETIFADCDVLIAPSAPGEAPEGMPTGNPIFNQAWTLLHVPCVSVPCGRGPRGLPLGVQVIGRRNADAATLLAAEWIFRVLSPDGCPALPE